nr:extensin [Drosophila kikkawai]
MWFFRQNLDVDTSIKISPLCYRWQSCCWIVLKGLNIWRFILGLHPAFQMVISFLLIGLGVKAILSLKSKWQRREKVQENPVAEVLPVAELAPLVPEPEVALPEVIYDPEPADTSDQSALIQDENPPETEIPSPSQQPQSVTPTNQRETRPKQMRKTRIPVLNSKTNNGPQTSPKEIPLKRSPALTNPNPRPMGSSPTDLNSNPRQNDVRKRVNNSTSRNWKL